MGASGSIKAIQSVCVTCGWTEQAITPTALRNLARKLVKAKHIDAADLPGLSDTRRPILPGAVAVLTALFNSLKIAEMTVSDKALREGLLLDLIGRDENRDIREISVAETQRRYALDVGHAGRVAATCQTLLNDVRDSPPDLLGSARLLHWAALVHEIGLTIAHKGYHKHGAYIVRHTDLAGFSQSEQAVIATLLHLHRGKFRRGALDELPSTRHATVAHLAVLLRLAVLLHRGRDPDMRAPVRLAIDGETWALAFDDSWLDAHPMTRADLVREQAYLAAAGYILQLRAA